MEIKEYVEEITSLTFRDFFTNNLEHDKKGISAIHRSEDPGAASAILADLRSKLCKLNSEYVAFLGEDDGREQVELVVMPSDDIIEVADYLVRPNRLPIDKSIFLQRLRRWEKTLGMNIIQMSHMIFGFRISKLPKDLHYFGSQVLEIWPTIFDPEDLTRTSSGKLALKKDSYFERWLRRDKGVEGFWDA